MVWLNSKTVIYIWISKYMFVQNSKRWALFKIAREINLLELIIWSVNWIRPRTNSSRRHRCEKGRVSQYEAIKCWCRRWKENFNIWWPCKLGYLSVKLGWDNNSPWKVRVNLHLINEQIQIFDLQHIKSKKLESIWIVQHTAGTSVGAFTTGVSLNPNRLNLEKKLLSYHAAVTIVP